MSSDRYYHFEAIRDFESALQKHFWSGVAKLIFGQRKRLLSFDEIVEQIPFEGQYDAGTQEIPVSLIVGSTGRAQDFDANFLPSSEKNRHRWVNIARANLTGISLPPIDVYQVGGVYFVRDGNHRVSVASVMNQATIMANVVVVRVPDELEGRTDLENAALTLDRERFLRRTDLLNLRPEAKIEPTLPSVYARLLEHISTHQWFMGEHSQSPVSWEEAVVDWYNNVYLSMVRIIHEHRLLAAFPGRTETDLYLWISEHCWYQSLEAGGCVSYEDAALNFTERSASTFYRLLWQAVEPS